MPAPREGDRRQYQWLGEGGTVEAAMEGIAVYASTMGEDRHQRRHHGEGACHQRRQHGEGGTIGAAGTGREPC